MQVNLPYKPKWSREWIEKRLSKNYFKKPYDRFMWWRSYTPKNKPLTNRHPLRDRITNGDFEPGPYLMEVELVYHTMNDKYKESFTTGGELDYTVYIEKTSVDRARRKRLLEDHEKDEAKKLADLKAEFLKEFKMTGEQYDEEIVESSGTILDFYFEIEEKYSKYAIRPMPVPKF